MPAQLSFHPDSCSAPYMGPGTCDASCGRCKPCEGYVPSDFLPPPNVTAPAGDPPSASTALPVDATPISPNQHPNPGAPNPGNTSTGFGAPAPALPPVGPVLRAPAPETGSAPAPCVADITVRSCPSPANADNLGRNVPTHKLLPYLKTRPFCSLSSIVQGHVGCTCIQVGGHGAVHGMVTECAPAITRPLQGGDIFM